MGNYETSTHFYRNMIILYCKQTNELVSVPFEDITFCNIYQQEDGILINVVGESFNIEALRTNIVPVPEVYKELFNSSNNGFIEVDALFIRDVDSLEESEEEEDNDTEDTDW